jgi:hypothetical protein
MKHLYLLIIFTISFSVYSQNTGSVFTYNFDSATNAAGFITAIDENESSWSGTKAQAGYVGVLGVPDPNNPGAIKCPKDSGNTGLPKPDGSTAYYTQRYPNTNQAATPSLDVDISSVVHYSVAFKGWQITHESNNSFQFNLKNSSNKMIACIKIEQAKDDGAFVDDKVRIVGSLYNGQNAGKQYSAGHFGVGSGTNTTPVNVGITIDYANDTWAFWTGSPGSTDGFAGTYGGVTGTFGGNGDTTSVAGVIPDHISMGFRRPAGGGTGTGTNPGEGTVGTEDYILIDQIKVSQGEYVNTLSVDNSVDGISFNIYPNPADDFIFIENLSIDSKVDLFNVVGKNIKSFEIESHNQRLDINGLNSGVYFVKVDDKAAAKFIKR